MVGVSLSVVKQPATGKVLRGQCVSEPINLGNFPSLKRNTEHLALARGDRARVPYVPIVPLSGNAAKTFNR